MSGGLEGLFANKPAAKGEGRTPKKEPVLEMPLFGHAVNYREGRGGLLPVPGQGAPRAAEERKRFISAAPLHRVTEPPVFTAGAVTINPLHSGCHIPALQRPAAL